MSYLLEIEERLGAGGIIRPSMPSTFSYSLIYGLINLNVFRDRQYRLRGIRLKTIKKVKLNFRYHSSYIGPS